MTGIRSGAEERRLQEQEQEQEWKREPERWLIVRLHSLGDVALTTGLVHALAAGAGRPAGGPPSPRIEVLTEARFAPIFGGHPSVRRVWTREELPATGAMNAHGWGPWDRVIDLQGSVTSRRLVGGAAARSSVRSRSLLRRWVCFWGDRFPRPRIPHVLERYAEAVGSPIDSHRAPPPLIRVTEEDRLEAARLAPGILQEEPGRAVAFLTGASRRSKEYPGEQFAELERLLRRTGRRVWWIAPPGGQAPADVSLTNSISYNTPRGSALPAGEAPVFRLPLGALKGLLERAALVVSNDSGPMHLAAGLGVPVVAIFGSSVRAFGFAPTGRDDRVCEVGDLACRPCGVHGRDRCWLGHWRCLRDLAPELVLRSVLEVLEGSRRNGEGNA